jgi:hypothetical protein
MCDHEPTPEELQLKERVREVDSATGEVAGFDPAPGPTATAIMNAREESEALRLLKES